MIDLSLWPGLSLVGPLGGGHRDSVFEVRGAGRFVARRSRRTDAGLDRELNLLDLPTDHGFLVPSVVPATDGRRAVGVSSSRRG